MSMFNNLTIPRKLIVALGLLLATVLLVDGVVYLKSAEIKQATGWAEHTHQVLEALLQTEAGMVEQEAGFRGYVIAGQDSFLVPYQAGRAKFDRAFAAVKSLTSDNPAQQARLAEMHQMAEQWQTEYAERGITMMATPETRGDARALVAGGSGKGMMAALHQKAIEMADIERALLVSRSAAQEAAFDTTAMTIMGGTAANVVIAIGIGVLLTRSIARPISRVTTRLAALASPVDTGRRDEVGRMEGSVTSVEAAFQDLARVLRGVAIGDLTQNVERDYGGLSEEVAVALRRMTVALTEAAGIADSIAGGDLTVAAKRLSDQDTLGIALERMLEKLRQVVSEAMGASDNVASGSQQLLASAEQLSQGATEQASAAEEASSSMEQMAANVKQNADSAAQTEKIARQSALDAEASGVTVTRAVQAMETIAQKITIVQEIAR